MRPSLFAGIMLGATIALTHNAQAADHEVCVAQADVIHMTAKARDAGAPKYKQLDKMFKAAGANDNLRHFATAAVDYVYESSAQLASPRIAADAWYNACRK